MTRNPDRDERKRKQCCFAVATRIDVLPIF